ncbi:PREDICTED: uncharacterized protein LOC109339516 [Lupinus angustifolius]|uniref:uncharacterized protein LOC109339516 n=1 Tax=Lupinus angustifolius TaxID=3871 RepID=UPI00092E4595|nr:PREDICTED: uncharacterized protein LOC109339516 [Lupinus angustifolius]
MDIQKAYNTLEWDALESIMIELGFPHHFVRWTKLRVNTVSYRCDPIFVSLMMNNFTEFSKCTGLQASSAKCEVYFGGIDVLTQATIQASIGFNRGSLPFKYLGVPLDSKKLTINQCSPLIEKITLRLRHWSTRLLSYACRLQLIRSVMFSITNYWMQVFPLPKKILYHIEAK